MAIFSICKQINDPRIDRKRVHSADAIVYIAMAAVICGAESWYEIEDFGNAKIDFFRERLPGLESIPSHDTFNRFFSALNPEYFERIFRHWMFEIRVSWPLTARPSVVPASVPLPTPPGIPDLSSIWSVPGLQLMESALDN